MKFYVGLDDVYNARHFDRAFISVNRLKTRKSDFVVNDWIMDSGAFTEITNHGHYRDPVTVYASHIRRWANVGNLQCAVAQDFMCEPFVLAKTGLDVPTHQRLTIERYDELISCDLAGVEIMPVLQGFTPDDYIRHLDAYGERITEGMYVGVGSVCKRQGSPEAIVDLLSLIKRSRPDIRLHGFGVKTTSLRHAIVRELLYSSDSMAWSFAARKTGRNAHDWREARAFEERINNILTGPAAPTQLRMIYA